MCADRHIVGDLHEIVDFDALANPGGADRRAVNCDTRADFHVVFNDDISDLRNFFLLFRGGHITKTIRSDDAAGMNDDGIPDHAIAVNHYARMQNGLVADLHVFSDKGVAADHGLVCDFGTVTNNGKRFNGHIFAEACGFSDGSLGRNRLAVRGGRIKLLKQFCPGQFRVFDLNERLGGCLHRGGHDQTGDTGSLQFAEIFGVLHEGDQARPGCFHVRNAFNRSGRIADNLTIDQKGQFFNRFLQGNFILMRHIRSSIMTGFCFVNERGMTIMKLMMRNMSLCAIFSFLFILSGCFESQFDFKTVVHPDGSVVRQTQIEGRGAALFKVPAGEGWQSRVWDTKGTTTLLLADVHHVAALGEFKPGQAIPGDYAFDFSKQIQSWQEEDRKKVEKAGIQLPFEENLFSHNQIRVIRQNGFLTVTMIYEEVFQNAGVMNLLLIDLKEELAKQGAQSGQDLKDPELEELARLRLESEILPEIRFKSEVRLPGKIISTNGKPAGNGVVRWQFSLKDFQKGYSTYTLQAVSRTLKVPGFWMLSFLVALFLFCTFLVLAGVKQVSSKRKPNK